MIIFKFMQIMLHILYQNIVLFFKGAMDKKADGVIWLPFLQFSTIFNETLSTSFFFQGRLNRVLRSDLTSLHSAHLITAQSALCTGFPTFLFFKVESWFFLCGIELRFR